MKRYYFLILVVILTFLSCKSDHSPSAEKPSPKTSSPATTSNNTTRTVNTPTDTIIVNSMEELVVNAKSNRILALRNIDYKLNKNLVYYMSKDENRIIDKNIEDTKSLGGQLYISGLDNFQIIGQEETEMISDNELAIPLYVIKSNNVKIKNIKFRHADNVKSKLKVPLSSFSGCSKLVVSNCKFEGKGTYGVNLNDVNNFIFVGGEISKCTQGIVNIINSKFVSFETCELKNNRCAYSAINVKGSDNSVHFKNVTMAYNLGLNNNEPKSKFFNIGLNSVFIDGCTLKGNKNFSNVGLSLDQIRKCELSGMNI